MQRLQTVFQLSMVALLCLSATIFAAAEEQPLVSLTLPAAIISWAVVDRRQGKGLGPGWSFALGLIGVAAAAIEFGTGGIEARILAPSHLLAYLVWIVLFQHKENRHYWILLGLTVLQVAIASLAFFASANGRPPIHGLPLEPSTILPLASNLALPLFFSDASRKPIGYSCVASVTVGTILILRPIDLTCL